MPVSRFACPSCRTRGECHPDIHGVSLVYDETKTPGRCCKCWPLRLCVTLTMPEGCACPGDDPTDDADRTIGAYCELDCTEYSYTGSFACRGTGQTVDFKIYMVETIGAPSECWLAFESECLGYIGPDLLLIPLGGEYQDRDEKRAECDSFSWDFEIDLGECFYGCGAGTVSIAPADTVPVPRCCPTSCPYARACLTLTSDYGEEKLLVCVTEGAYGHYYRALFDDPFSAQQIEVVVHVDDADLSDGMLDLRIEADFLGQLVSEETQSVACPYMVAEWEFYDGWTLSIKGDNHAGCSDCRCVCRCICVTKITDNFLATVPTVFTGVGCWEETYACADGEPGGWDVELTDIEGEQDAQTARFHLECDECTGTTYIVYDGKPNDRREIDCPDIRNPAAPEVPIEWVVTDEGEQPYTIRVECVACRPCGVRPPITPCCPDRAYLPPVLHLEITSTNAACTCLLGLTAVLIFNGDEFDPKWTGTLTGAGGGCPDGTAELTLECSGPGCDSWTLTGCGPMELQAGCSCDPLELAFCGGGGCSLCEDPATSEYCLVITE